MLAPAVVCSVLLPGGVFLFGDVQRYVQYEPPAPADTDTDTDRKVCAILAVGAKENFTDHCNGHILYEDPARGFNRAVCRCATNYKQEGAFVCKEGTLVENQTCTKCPENARVHRYDENYCSVRQCNAGYYFERYEIDGITSFGCSRCSGVGVQEYHWKANDRCKRVFRNGEVIAMNCEESGRCRINSCHPGYDLKEEKSNNLFLNSSNLFLNSSIRCEKNESGPRNRSGTNTSASNSTATGINNTNRNSTNNT